MKINNVDSHWETSRIVLFLRLAFFDKKDVSITLHSKKSNIIENNSNDCCNTQQSTIQDTYSIENLLK